MSSEGEIILSYYDTLLRKSDVALLEGPKWLNDNIISFWLEYLEHELYADVKQWVSFLSPQVAQFIKSAASSPDNIADVISMLEPLHLNQKRLILIPINDCETDVKSEGGTHWSLLVYHSANAQFEHYDSHSGSVNRLHAELIVSILTPVILPGHESDLELDFTEMECTQQNNGYDCGTHVLRNSEAVLRKYFRNDNRHITEIASSAVVKKTRKELLQIIYSLRNKNARK